MAQNREKLTKRQKGYIKITIANIIFFGAFIVGFLWENTLPGLQVDGVLLLFLIVSIPYSIWYGFFSYRATEQIILPNLLLGLFGLIIFLPFFVILSVIASLLTKLITNLWRKWSAEMDAQILAAEAQSAQESAELEEPAPEESKEE